jgi:hypothetical protein
METEINNLINKLDISTDILLIELLKQKLVKRYTYNPTFTDKEIKYAKQGLVMVVNNISKKERFNIVKYKKATTILDNNRCDGYKEFSENSYPKIHCKYAIDKEMESSFNMRSFIYKDNDETNPVCISCKKRCDILEKIIHNYNENSYQFQDTLITKETIEVFAVINKIKNKLKEIKK